MPKITEEGPIIYVEPNEIGEGNDFASMLNADTSKPVYRAPSLEDYCIVVDLDVEVKGRTYTSTKTTDDKVVRLEYTSSSNGEKVHFMEGSKIYLDAQKTKYITSLTTNYTDTHLTDLSGGTCEMFGINSINIEYNSWMVPQVTIQFTDVRGVSLFAQEEMRHNLTDGKMSGIANNGIEGSFFKCFFTFPYPKFTLKVKGFYGQMVSYELTCSDFRSAFDSSTGNFTVTAQFVGYAFSFLTDVMANATLAAPYSEYLGKDYWETNNGTRFTVIDKNGSYAKMKTLGEIVQAFTQIKQDVANQIANSSVDDLNVSQDVKDKINQDDSLSRVKDAHEAVVKASQKLKNALMNANGNMMIQTSGSNSFIIINDDIDNSDHKAEWQNALLNFKSAVDTLNTEINTAKDKNQALSAWKSKNPNDLHLEGINAEHQVNDSDFESLITEPSLKNEYLSYRDRYYDNYWNAGWRASYAYIYEEHDLNQIAKVTLATIGSSSGGTEETQQLAQEVENQLMNQAFENAFDFPPTVENMTRIFMAHMETFIYMVSTCAQNIIGNNANRTIGSIGANLDDFVDIPKDKSSDAYLIPPFPKVTQEINQDGITKREDAWIGNFGDESKFEEIKLVSGILKGVEEVAKLTNFASQAQATSANTSEYSCCLKYPLSWIDVFMWGNDRPFGDIDLNYIDSVLGHFCVRAFANIACQENMDSYANDMGKLDAENFLKFYESNASINSLKNALKTMDANKAITNLTTNTSWDSRFKGLIRDNKTGWYYMPQFLKSNKEVTQVTNAYIPVKNWNWSQWNNINANGISKIIPKTFVNSTDTVNKQSASALLFYGKLSYIANAISLLPEGSIKETFTNIYPISNTSVGGLATFSYFLRGSDGVSKIDINSLIYNSDGELTNGDNVCFDLWKCINNENIYKVTSNYDKAVRLFSNFHNNGVSTQDWLTFLNNFSSNSQKKRAKVVYLSKFYALYVGAFVYQNMDSDDRLKAIRRDVKLEFKNYFTNWVDKEFATFSKTFMNGLNKPNSQFKTLKDQNNKVVPNLTEEMKKLVVDWGKIHAFAFTTIEMNSSHQNIILKSNTLSAYLDGVITTLKEKLGVEEGTVDGSGDNGNQASVTLNVGEDSDDIRIGVYNYVKMLYDKWIAADPSNDFYSMETLFDGSNPTFFFIDSFYNKIGKVMYINISTLVDQIVSSQTQAGLPLIGMLSQMYADNKFNFLCIQNFVDRSQKEKIKEMFTPISYLNRVEPDNHPDFIVMYPYEASSKLDVSEGDYQDDGFYFTDKTTWPVMITSKESADSLKIPAFGVTYGMQYQSYFKSIQVDMNTPMATEQSIKAKFLIAGANTNNTNGENTGPRHVTVGQDLYTIYSNNSYTCTVTMLGCMWIQPLMYFQLNNIPMFRGSYMIVKVTHQIEAGNATTTFVGVRMARTSTRAVQQYLYGMSSDSGTDLQSMQDAFAHSNANIGNDCEYAYYSPLPSEGADFSQELSWKLYDNLSENGKNLLDGKWGNGTGFKNWTILDALACIAWKEFSGTDPKAVANRAAVVACMYNYRGCCGSKGYATHIFKSGWRYFEGNNSTFTSYRAELLKIRNSDNFNTSKTMIQDIWANGPYNYLVGKTNTIGGQVTKEQVQRGFTTRGSSDSSKTLKSLASYGDTLYALEPYGKLYHIIGGLNDKKFKNGFIPQPTVKKSGTQLINQIKSGLTTSLQASLRASQYYANTTVSSTMGAGQWLKLTASGENANNALFDCLIESYSDWFETIYWDKGNGNMDGDAKAVVVRVVTSAPKSHFIGICANFTMSGANIFPTPAIRYTNINQLNKSLKLCMIKYFKKNSITDANVAKKTFTTLTNIDNNTIKTTFELTGTSTSGGSIQECSSLAGYPNNIGGGVGSINITDGTIAAANDRSTKQKKIQELFGGSLPATEAQARSFCETFKVKTLVGTFSITLHKALKTSFLGIINDLNNAGFKVYSVGNGFSWRSTANGNRSNHSYGVAVDINACSQGNPWFGGKIGTSFTPQQTKALGFQHGKSYNGSYDANRCIWTWNHPAVSIFAKHGWGWGGSYGDSMHFSYFGGG